MNYPEPFKTEVSRYYQFDYINPKTKRRTRKSTKCITKIEARQFIHNFMHEIHLDISRVPFGEYSQPFFIWDECPRVKRMKYEGKIIGQTYCQKMRGYLDRFFSGSRLARIPMNEIRRSNILDFRDELVKLTSVNQANQTIQAVKAILSEAFFREDIVSNPGSRIGMIKYEKKERGILSIDTIKKLFSSTKYWQDEGEDGRHSIFNELYYRYFKFLAYTGMRTSEVAALIWGQISGSTLKVDRAFKQTWGYTVGLPKWDKVREIYLPPPLTSLLNEIREDSLHVQTEDLVFCRDDGKRLGDTKPRNRFYQALEKLIPDRKEQNITAHSLRHSLNTHLLSAGVDPLKVQLYLGWSNTAVRSLTPVQIGYTHLTGHDLRDVAETIDSIYSIK